MKKTLLVLVAFTMLLVMVTSAQAALVMKYDLSGLGAGLGQTTVWDEQILTTVDATSNYAAGIFPGAGFVDVGDLKMGTLNYLGNPLSGAQNQDLNGSWELTGRWSDLTGTMTAITPTASGTLFNFIYTSGTAKLFADPTVNANFGAGIGSNDDTASTFTDGTELASIKLLSGVGSLFVPFDGSAATGSTFTKWDILSVPAGYWLDPTGFDLKSSLEASGWVDVNTIVSSNVTITGTGPGSQILSRNQGHASYNVPEPASMLLFGMGMLGLGATKLRRKKVN